MHLVQNQVAQREKPAPGRDIRRRQKRVLSKRKKNLTEQEQVKLDKEIHNAPILKTAYEVKEAFFAIYALKTPHVAESALAKWRAGGCSTPLPSSFSSSGPKARTQSSLPVASSAFLVIMSCSAGYFLRRKSASSAGLVLSGIALLSAPR
jgi:hypothetical protein